MGVRYLCTCVRNADVAARVALLCQLAGEKFIELGAEYTISDKLALFADLGGHYSGGAWGRGQRCR